MDRLEIGAAAEDLAGMATALVEEDGHGAADDAGVEGGLLVLDQGLQAGQAILLRPSSTWPGMAAAGVPGRREYLKVKAPA